MHPRIAQFKDVAAFRARLAELQLELPCDDKPLSAAEGSPLAVPGMIGGITIGNRWCIHPMEGWDANLDGSPSELTLRRWRNFGLSGAKLIWGGEAAAVVPEGRANPRQTLATPENLAGLRTLLSALTDEHLRQFGSTDDLLVGLQLTHSGRYSRPTADGPRPRIACHHPLLDGKVGIAPDDDAPLLTDDELQRLLDQFVTAAGTARDAGFRFVDLKACHGYLVHELLGAHTRPGRFGGDFDGRTRFLRELIGRVRSAWPDLLIGARLSAFDTVPFQPGPNAGEPAPHASLIPYNYAFGIDRQRPTHGDLTETVQLLKLLRELGVAAVNLSAGSPYYNPHVQRPALFPPSDGYLPPEDPLVGVVRQIHAVRDCRAAVPGLPVVGTAYSYLQEYLPHVAQAVVRAGWADFIGLGRVVLSYPELPADVLAGRFPNRKRLCRTFSDCTTGPRLGLVSGCYPLDPYYKSLPEAEMLKGAKRSTAEERAPGPTVG